MLKFSEYLGNPLIPNNYPLNAHLPIILYLPKISRNPSWKMNLYSQYPYSIYVYKQSNFLQLPKSWDRSINKLLLNILCLRHIILGSFICQSTIIFKFVQHDFYFSRTINYYHLQIFLSINMEADICKKSFCYFFLYVIF